MPMYDRISDLKRPRETVYSTVHEVHYTSDLNYVNIVFKSYRIVRDCSQVLHPTPGITLACHTITIVIRPVRFQYESYVVVKYGQNGLVRVYTVLHGLVRSFTAFMSVQGHQHGESYCNT